MAVTQTMSIPDFLRGAEWEDTTIRSIIAHFEKHKIKYRIIGTVVVLFLGLSDVTFAASTGIDAGANKIYRKLVNIGKWVIIIKGAIDTLKSVSDGDLPATKKNFLGYGVTYLILLGLPWMMSEIEKLFQDMDS